jgi:histidinol-phosphate aminotransferase
VPYDFVKLAVPSVQTLQPYQPGKPDSEVRREHGLTEVIKLASNENPLGPSPKAVAALQDCLGTIARYPDGNGFELKAALSAHLEVPAESITLGNGSNDVLEIIARTFLSPAHASVFSQHAFAVYALVTQAIGAEARIAGANPLEHAIPYGHDLTAMAYQIYDKTRLVFIANPNNPTGTWLTEDELEAFLKRMPDQVIVVVDEAYAEYVEIADYPNTLRWLDRFPNLIVTRTFSKAYGLAGLRVGYAVSHPQIAELLNRVRQPFNVSIPAQVAAIAALADNAHIQHSRLVNREGMRFLQSACDELGLRYLPSIGNFLCVNVGRPGLEVFQKLLRKGIIVRPVSNYGLVNFVRITIGSERENAMLIAAMKDVLE